MPTPRKPIWQHILEGTFREDRHGKRRIEEEAAAKYAAENPPEAIEEAKAWAVTFETGRDYFGDLRPYALTDDKAVQRAASGAWKRLGARFMARWKPTAARAQPWALERFGEPQ